MYLKNEKIKLKIFMTKGIILNLKNKLHYSRIPN